MEVDSKRLQREIYKNFFGKYPAFRWDRRTARFKNSPMQCKHKDCAAFRKRDKVFAQKMQDAGIVAHYMGKGFMPFDEGEYWMLIGITPISRSELERMIADYK